MNLLVAHVVSAAAAPLFKKDGAARLDMVSPENPVRLDELKFDSMFDVLEELAAARSMQQLVLLLADNTLVKYAMQPWRRASYGRALLQLPSAADIARARDNGTIGHLRKKVHTDLQKRTRVLQAAIKKRGEKSGKLSAAEIAAKQAVVELIADCLVRVPRCCCRRCAMCRVRYVFVTRCGARS